MDILNAANAITRNAIGISTIAELKARPLKEDIEPRCNEIIKLAEEIRDIYKEEVYND